MISKRCDNCEVLIEVDDDKAGQKVACPDCGDINRIPAAPVAEKPAAPADAPAPPRAEPEKQDTPEQTAKAALRDRAMAAGLPPDSGPEQRVAVFRPAMLRAKPALFIGVAIGILAGLAMLIYFGLVNKSTNWATAGAYFGLFLMLAGFAFMGVWKIKTLTEALEITNKRSIAREGLLSKATSEVLHDNIRNIQITQTFSQRIWGVGEIGISSAGQDGLEIDMKNLRKPDKIREMIDLYRPL
jgi:uncharacterized Zn finger protein (UPF0148 family)